MAARVAQVHLLDEIGHGSHAEVLQDERRQHRCRAAPVGMPHDGGESPPANPVAAPLVAENVSPAAAPGGTAVLVAPVADGSGAADDDDAAAVAGRRGEGDERVVDDQRRRLVADASHDAANDGRVVGAVGSGHAQADRRWHDGLARERPFHHLVQHLLDLELALRLQVRAGATSRGQDRARGISEQADGLRAAGVDAEHVKRLIRRARRSDHRRGGTAIVTSTRECVDRSSARHRHAHRRGRSAA